MYIYIYLYILTLHVFTGKCQNRIYSKDIFYIKSMIFQSVQKPSEDCALNKKCKNYIYLINSKKAKGKLKVE